MSGPRKPPAVAACNCDGKCNPGKVYDADEMDAYLTGIETELAELQRAKYGTPCKCESWMEACRAAEDTLEVLRAHLAAQPRAWLCEQHGLCQTRCRCAAAGTVIPGRFVADEEAEHGK